MNIVLLGPPAVGKGTLGTALAERYHLAKFDTGATLRRVPDPELQAHLARGGRAPTSLVMDLLDEALSAGAPGRAGWLVDGTPRTPEQAEAFIERWQSGAMPVSKVFVLEAPREMLIERTRGRRLCDRCGTTYHLTFAPPPTATHCTPECGGQLYVRDMDVDVAAMEDRLSWYQTLCVPANEMLRDVGIPVTTLDATRSAEAVFEDAAREMEALRTVGAARAQQPSEPIRRRSLSRR